jgi:hypothetical protein
MHDRPEAFAANFARCEQLMDVVRHRYTSRQFNPAIAVPPEHIEITDH